jgi:hypothetical protein
MSYIKHRKGRKERKGLQQKLFATFALFAVGSHGLPDMPPNINFKLTQSVWQENVLSNRIMLDTKI